MNATDHALRPLSFDQFFGQEKVKRRVRIAVAAALTRNEPLDHVLLTGPPGLGKTTMAHIIANALGKKLTVTSGPALENGNQLAEILAGLKHGDVIFIDEIHRLLRSIEERLYPCMEDFHVECVLNNVALRVKLDHFTVIGATTRTGLISPPLLNRFVIQEQFEPYDADELAQIVSRSAGLLNAPVQAPQAMEIARRCRGTPRTANNLLRRVRDYAQATGTGSITAAAVDDCMVDLEIDNDGLNRTDRKVLSTIMQSFGGGPVGVGSLAVALGEEPSTLQDVIEPYLIRQGYIQRTPRGRMATPQGYNRMGIPMPAATN